MLPSSPGGNNLLLPDPRFPKEEALTGPVRLAVIQRESEAKAQRLRLNLPKGSEQECPSTCHIPPILSISLEA